jgi:hypothetical protein
MRISSGHEKSACCFTAMALSRLEQIRVLTPGHGIDRDGRTLARQGGMGKPKEGWLLAIKNL